MIVFLLTGCAEQGQLGRVAECFAHRGGRKGLGKTVSIAFSVNVRLVGLGTDRVTMITFCHSVVLFCDMDNTIKSH